MRQSFSEFIILDDTSLGVITWAEPRAGSHPGGRYFHATCGCPSHRCGGKSCMS